MHKTHVLIVDDAALVRRSVAAVLACEPGYEVAGAASATIALAKIAQAPPDVVLLDVEMPETDGLSTLSEIRRRHPRLPVVMFSAMTERGAAVTLEALFRGADDYITKPDSTGGRGATLKRFHDDLVPKIEALRAQSGADPTGLWTAPPPPPEPAAPRTTVRGATAATPGRIDLVAVGASTGGPKALRAILSALPADFPVPVVVVLHMPALFTPYAVERLASACRIGVRAACHGDALAPGCAWIAPGGRHLTVERDAGVLCLRLDDGPSQNSCRPSIDRLFESVAEACGQHALAVVLTGMGCDGVRGSARVRAAGSDVLAQDRATSVVWGIPGLVVRDGLATGVLPLEQMAEEIQARARVGRAPAPGPGTPAEETS